MPPTPTMATFKPSSFAEMTSISARLEFVSQYTKTDSGSSWASITLEVFAVQFGSIAWASAAMIRE